MAIKKGTKKVAKLPDVEGRLFGFEQLQPEVGYDKLERVLLPEYVDATEKLRVAAYASVHTGLSVRNDKELRRRAKRFYDTISSVNTPEYFDDVNLFITHGSDRGLGDIYNLLEKQRISLEGNAEPAVMETRRLYSTAVLLTQALPRTDHLDELVRIARLYSFSTIKEGFKPNGFESVRNLAFELCSGDGATISRTVLEGLYKRYKDFSVENNDSWLTPDELEVDPRQFARTVNDAIRLHRDTTVFDELLTNRPCQYELDFGAVALQGMGEPLELVA